MSRTLECVEEPLRYKVLYRGRLLAAYNKGNPQYGDFFKSRPDIEPVYSLSGLAVTTTGAANYNHHKSIFWGHGNLNGYNFFHDNYPPFEPYGRLPPGDIVLEHAEVRIGDGEVNIGTINAWVTKVDVPEQLRQFLGGDSDETQRRLCRERRDIRFALGEGYYTIDAESEIEAADGDLRFAKDSHSFFGVRVSDAIDEEDGGLVIDSTGRAGAHNIYGQVVDWVDCSGFVGEHRVGVAVMSHPSNLPDYFRTRAYGLLLPCPFLHEDYVLQEGEKLRFRYRVVVHEGDSTAVDLPQLFEELATM